MKSFAKLNLCLLVGNRREDGRHYLRSIAAPLALHDDLQFVVGEGRIACSVKGDTQFLRHYGERAPEIIQLLEQPSNLAVRAAEAFFQRLGRAPTGRIEILKRIPLEAGLGGGSSNAATTLLLLNERFGSPLPRAELSALGAALGSDVPLFFEENGALLSGTGENVQPFSLPRSLGMYELVLVKPPTGVSTAEAYRQLNRPVGGDFQGDAAWEQAREGIAAGEISALRNDFESVVESLGWFQKAEQAHRANGALRVLLAGSGSTVCGFFRRGEGDLGKMKKILGEDWWLEKTQIVL